MENILLKLFCWIGVHQWIHAQVIQRIPGAMRCCTCCGTVQQWNFWSNHTHGWETVK